MFSLFGDPFTFSKVSAIYYGKEKRDAGELGVADIDRVLLHDYHNPWEARRRVCA